MAMLQAKPLPELGPDTTFRDILAGVSTASNTIAQMGGMINQIKMQEDQRNLKYNENVIAQAQASGDTLAAAMLKNPEVFNAVSSLNRYGKYGHFDKDAGAAIGGTQPLDKSLKDTKTVFSENLGQGWENNKLFADMYKRITPQVGDALDPAEQSAVLALLGGLRDPYTLAQLTYGQIDYKSEWDTFVNEVRNSDPRFKDATDEQIMAELNNEYKQQSGMQVQPAAAGVEDKTPVAPQYSDTISASTDEMTQPTTQTTTPTTKPVVVSDPKQAYKALGTIFGPNFQKITEKTSGGYAPGFEKISSSDPSLVDPAAKARFDKLLPQAYGNVANQAAQFFGLDQQARNDLARINNGAPDATLVKDILVKNKMIDAKVTPEEAALTWQSLRTGFAHTAATRGALNGIAPDVKLEHIYFPPELKFPEAKTKQAEVMRTPVVDQVMTAPEPSRIKEIAKKYNFNAQSTKLGVSQSDLDEALAYNVNAKEPQRADYQNEQAYINALKDHKQALSYTKNILDNVTPIAKLRNSLDSNAIVNVGGTEVKVGDLLKLTNKDEVLKADKKLRMLDVNLNDYLTDARAMNVPAIKQQLNAVQQNRLAQDKASELYLDQFVKMRNALLDYDASIFKTADDSKKWQAEIQKDLQIENMKLGLKTAKGLTPAEEKAAELRLKQFGMLENLTESISKQTKGMNQDAIKEWLNNKDGGKGLADSVKRLQEDLGVGGFSPDSLALQSIIQQAKEANIKAGTQGVSATMGGKTPTTNAAANAYLAEQFYK